MESVCQVLAPLITHSPTHSLTHSLTHSPTHSLTQEGQTAQDIESSPDISATFIGEFAILGLLCDKMEAEALGVDMHTTLLKRIHGLTLEQARGIDAKAVVPETDDEVSPDWRTQMWKSHCPKGAWWRTRKRACRQKELNRRSQNAERCNER